MSEYPEDFPDGWAIAGWGDRSGDWHNTEGDDRLPSGSELMDSDIVVRFTDSDGVDHYYSIMDGVDDWEGLADAIADLDEEYG